MQNQRFTFNNGEGGPDEDAIKIMKERRKPSGCKKNIEYSYELEIGINYSFPIFATLESNKKYASKSELLASLTDKDFEDICIQFEQSIKDWSSHMYRDRMEGVVDTLSGKDGNEIYSPYNPEYKPIQGFGVSWEELGFQRLTSGRKWWGELE